MQAGTDTRRSCDRRVEEELRAIEVRFIPHPDFSDSDAIHAILESITADRESPRVEASAIGISIPQVSLLTPAEEKHLFLKMNCLRSLAVDRRDRALEKGAREIDLRTVRNLLADADAIRGQISDANQRLVLKIAGKFSGTLSDTQDFVSEANLVMLTAIDRFDVSRGFRFSTYATHSLRRHLSRVWQRNAKRSTCPETDVERISLDDEQPWVDSEVKAMVPRILSSLNERQREVVSLRFGLSGKKPMRYNELGKRMNLSAERVRQIVLQACRRLREKYSSAVGLETA
ncbi:MAG: sigma-70 family RNA polymerase sigma factor [Planctomycetaceae bacterium]